MSQALTSIVENVTIRIGTAGWTIPKPHAGAFDSQGTHLQRYASRLQAVEINSSFYRSHKPETYARWAASVPIGFRFSIKLPREITHTTKLACGQDLISTFIDEVSSLDGTLGPLLVQLPPSLHFNQTVVGNFLDALRTRFAGQVACEPRHSTWFTDEVDAMLSDFQIARVAADPALVPRAALPGGWSGFVYRRLHGSPRMYYSPYSKDYLEAMAQRIRQSVASGPTNWCIFDNTALGEATSDALRLCQGLHVVMAGSD